jgi:flavin reductase (DIM6/NTAB) family NADH-FMN oxidoreductase RutF
MTDQSAADAEKDGLQTIGSVLGRTPSGVFILTASDGSGRETGMLASWVQQASFDPPAVTVAINSKRYLNDWLETCPRMVLNLVSTKQTGFLKHFGRGFEPGHPAFEGQATRKGETGLTVLCDALAYLEGEVTAKMDAGDHIIYLLKITAAGSSDKLDSEKPMVHIRKNGFNY